MIITKQFGWILVFLSSSIAAAEYSACTNPDHPFQKLSHTELQTIAKSCHSKKMAQLYYNRAYHKHVITKAKALADLDSQASNANRQSIISHSLYMAMIEEFAKIWIPNQTTRIEFLNSSYLHHDEILELRLQGQNKQADQIERQALKQSQKSLKQ